MSSLSRNLTSSERALVELGISDPSVKIETLNDLSKFLNIGRGPTSAINATELMELFLKYVESSRNIQRSVQGRITDTLKSMGATTDIIESAWKTVVDKRFKFDDAGSLDLENKATWFLSAGFVVNPTIRIQSERAPLGSLNLPTGQWEIGGPLGMVPAQFLKTHRLSEIIVEGTTVCDAKGTRYLPLSEPMIIALLPDQPAQDFTANADGVLVGIRVTPDSIIVAKGPQSRSTIDTVRVRLVLRGLADNSVVRDQEKVCAVSGITDPIDLLTTRVAQLEARTSKLSADGSSFMGTTYLA